MTTPTVGRMVHYVSHGTPPDPLTGISAYTQQCRSAIVTQVSHQNPERIGLCAINPTGLFFRPLSEGGCVEDRDGRPAGGTWHWPEWDDERIAMTAYASMPGTTRVTITVPDPPTVEVETINDCGVGMRAGDIVLSLIRPGEPLVTGKAIRCAAWIVAILDSRDEFDRVLAAIEKT